MDILWLVYLCNFLGYLLDPNGEKCVTAPRQVSALHHKDITLSLVAASDGATVCVTTRGDIYLLTDYQCKKMASKYVYFSERNIILGLWYNHWFVCSLVYIVHLFILKRC